MIITLIFRFKIPLPKDILSEGDHKVLVDSKEEYFGIVAQKKSNFENQCVLTSSRTAEKLKKEKAIAKEKKKISKKFDDEMLKLDFCKKFAAQHKKKEIEEERTKREKATVDKEKKEKIKDDDESDDEIVSDGMEDEHASDCEDDDESDGEIASESQEDEHASDSEDDDESDGEFFSNSDDDDKISIDLRDSISE